MKLTLLGQILTGALVLHQSFVVALLLSRREERKDHSLAMAVFFLANLITSLPDLVSFFRPGLQVAPYDLMTMPFAVLLGPALYFYARALVSPDPVRPSRQDLRHLGPSAATGLLVEDAVFIQAQSFANRDVPQGNIVFLGSGKVLESGAPLLRLDDP